MIPALAYAVIGLAAISVLWGIVTAIKDIPPGRAQLLFAAGVWLRHAGPVDDRRGA